MTTQSTTSPASGSVLKRGFTDPVFEAQASFRAALLSTAYPGRIVNLNQTLVPPQPLCSATAALCLTLLDFETPTWLDRQAASPEAVGWLGFHCGLPIIEETRTAQFAVITDATNLPRLFEFDSGNIEYPDRSTTLIVQVPSLENGPVTSWTGPGIKTRAAVGVAGLPSWFWSDWDLNKELYPRGIDVVFTSGSALIGLPRTIEVEA
ncbi:phosphonate C-P lyase system protein PhnH [Bradyrhizobium valentinum]|uniref:phosphonate C-P lyase system protein PhnH n=1 Tax=Bradyrhizobium valentinum TaxID=1518501 RepID=UPI00070C47A5|nr:phosphonate C-P lyase system protein PhnH [Bradyrhizobium valentinum]KRQ95434.1 phosphonate C-P lyase system protein PhnH [Bradyrhizobium valentinum]